MAQPIPSGYSGTALVKKLGLKPNFTIRIFHAPENYFSMLEPLPENLQLTDDPNIQKDFIHFFVDSFQNLELNIDALRKEIKPNGMIWISWPKKASKVITDVTEDKIRDLALQHELVDVKVAAIDEIWSGLKLVIPVKLR